MGDYKNLSGKEALDKIRDLVEAENVCMFVTNLDSTPLNGRPMATQEVDEDGNIWFMSREDSDKNEDILIDSRVQLFYNNKSSAEYLSIYGEAEISRDRDKIDKLWSPLAKAWFNEGKNDPSITLLKVVPQDAYYWDTKSNKIISLIKIAAGAISGHEFDGGIEGRIKL